ncbi:MAG: zinc ribbon domain-containing protein [Chloroflexi bacterium]|nr:zinc ribbon domain-containing protein [Chloroflexota bacterium]
MGARSPKVVHPRRVSSIFLLSGLLFCSCGRALTGCSAKSGRHFYYICSRSSRQGKEACSAKF